MRRRSRLKLVVLLVALIAVAGGYAAYKYYFTMGVSEAQDLNAFVHSKPRVPVVFTSRTEPASFVAPAPEAEGFAYPGTIPWAAAEGRLRLLDPEGKVYELTWGRELPDGGTLIDVMSPSVSIDGKRILFAGRKAAPDPGRWRIYEVGVNGRGLRQLTGGQEDPGCVSLPPMRYAQDGSLIDPDERKRLDYDDVDPTDRGTGFIFASSRMPDLGRDHARRATQIWSWTNGDAAPVMFTANRNNDRWPFLTCGEHLVLFSLWSRNREAVTEDASDVRPVSTGGNFATSPTDQWVGSRINLGATQFGFAVKIPEPVWRPRPLFNGRVAFMTNHPAGGGRLRLAQADWGYLRLAPSALAKGSEMPNQVGGTLLYAPDKDNTGRDLTMGCPSPYPGELVLFAGAPVGEPPSAFGLYLLPQEWTTNQLPQLLFDDPRLVDSEPVAVYRRSIEVHEHVLTMANTAGRPSEMPLISGQNHPGPFGQVHNSMINVAAPDPFLGQQTDTGEESVIPPPRNVKSIAFFAAYRDRFDDPEKPRIAGEWERLRVAPLDKMGHGRIEAWVPSLGTSTSVLAGLDENGKVAKWSSKAKDSAGRSASFFALAGDHYSGTRPNGLSFCLGCHTGHTFIPVTIKEKMQE